METTKVMKPTRPIEYDVLDDDTHFTTRMPSSARRYKPSPSKQPEVEKQPSSNGTLIQKRRASLNTQPTSGVTTNAVAPSRLRAIGAQKRFPLVALLVGMVVMIMLIMCLTALISWWNVYQDDLHYGRPRTFQLDSVVGHGDSPSTPTHFIFINLHRHIEVIEIPAGNPARSRIFTGPVLYGDGQDLTPVTGEIRDVNGDNKPDLIIHIQNQRIIFINDGTTFHPQ